MLIFMSEQDCAAAAECSQKGTFLNRLCFVWLCFTYNVVTLVKFVEIAEKKATEGH